MAGRRPLEYLMHQRPRQLPIGWGPRRLLLPTFSTAAQARPAQRQPAQGLVRARPPDVRLAGRRARRATVPTFATDGSPRDGMGLHSRHAVLQGWNTARTQPSRLF
ncbi:hypothetical protein GCM10009850_096660 [Nonomuraea monospora]|uniref:Uncharacterized protein n=1 Tax=Nonomuraea monospora TaxID=568818 RepID=A0ABP5PRB1_9ACTN